MQFQARESSSAFEYILPPRSSRASWKSEQEVEERILVTSRARAFTFCILSGRNSKSRNIEDITEYEGTRKLKIRFCGYPTL